MRLFIESLAVLIILIPVCTFVTKHFGFDQSHFGLLMTIATQIGAVTPPVAFVPWTATYIPHRFLGP